MKILLRCLAVIPAAPVLLPLLAIGVIAYFASSITFMLDCAVFALHGEWPREPKDNQADFDWIRRE